MSTDVGNRLSEINAELSSILEARIQELSTAMRGAEQVTRQVVSTEMEIARFRQLGDSLSAEIGDLKREVSALRARADEVRAQHGGLITDRERLRAEVDRMERDLREGDGEATALRSRARALESESDGLKKETGELKSKIKAMEEGVAKMRKLKEEQMLILSQQMAALNLGKE
jgi:chromosome segregation ATPase